MMFKAVDEQGIPVRIDAAQDDKTYYCPVCKCVLVIRAKKSERVATHFAHRTLKDCDSFSHDMSDWHKAWQNLFPIKNQEVPLPFEKPCHRADVLAYGYVIEFQHSPISVEEFDERNRFYTSLGKKVVWIFDVSDKYKAGRFSMIKPTYIYDGEYFDSNGIRRKKWIVNEFRTGNTFAMVGYSEDGCYGTGVDYEYGRNNAEGRKRTHEWNWQRPLGNLIHYNPMVNENIIVFLEFISGVIHKILWCDDIIEKSTAGKIAESLHEYGFEYSIPSVSRYYEFRDKFAVKSDFRHFTATEYTVKEFVRSIKERQL